MEKICISDLDEAFGDCDEGAKKIGIYQEYKYFRDNPEMMETNKFTELDKNTMNNFRLLAEKFTVYDGGPELINVLIKNGYQFCFSTNNALTSLEENRNILREKFSYCGVKPKIEFHSTKIIKHNGGKPVIVPNGSKKDYAEIKFKHAERGIHISDNRHELESACHIDRLNTEKFYNIINIKLGDEDLELYNGVNITYKKSISNILEDKDLIRKFC